MWRPRGKGGQGPKGRHYRKNIILRIRGSDLTHKLEVNGKTDSTSYTRKRKIRINKYDEKWGERRKTINTPERHIQTWTVKGYSLVRERPSTCPFFLHQGTI